MQMFLFKVDNPVTDSNFPLSRFKPKKVLVKSIFLDTVNKWSNSAMDWTSHQTYKPVPAPVTQPDLCGMGMKQHMNHISAS